MFGDSDQEVITYAQDCKAQKPAVEGPSNDSDRPKRPAAKHRRESNNSDGKPPHKVQKGDVAKRLTQKPPKSSDFTSKASKPLDPDELDIDELDPIFEWNFSEPSKQPSKQAVQVDLTMDSDSDDSDDEPLFKPEQASRPSSKAKSEEKGEAKGEKKPAQRKPKPKQALFEFLRTRLEYRKPEYDWRIPEDRVAAFAKFGDTGVMAFSHVLTPDEVAQSIHLFDKDINKVNPALKMVGGDWTNSKRLACQIMSVGIGKNPNAGFQQGEYAWHMRLGALKVQRGYDNYKKLGPSAYAVSLDTCQFAVTGRQMLPFWLHTDQGVAPKSEQLQMMMMSITDPDGGFAYVERSKDLHPAMMRRLKNPKRDFNQISIEDATEVYGPGCKVVCIQCLPGDLIFWDSRLGHSPIPPIDPNSFNGPVLLQKSVFDPTNPIHRMGMYMSFRRKDDMSEVEWEKWSADNAAGIQTNHQIPGKKTHPDNRRKGADPVGSCAVSEEKRKAYTKYFTDPQ